MPGRIPGARSLRSLTTPPSWRGFLVCVALPAAVLAMLGIRAARFEARDRERDLSEQRAQTAFLAEGAIGTALGRLEDDAGRWIETPPSSSLAFTLDRNDVLFFPKDRVYIAPDLAFAPSARQIRLDPGVEAAIDAALAAESQGNFSTARSCYDRVAALAPKLMPWASFALARLEARNRPEALHEWTQSSSSSTDSLSPSGFPLPLLAALQMGGPAARDFQTSVLKALRKGTWWLRYEERKLHDAALSGIVAVPPDPRLPLFGAAETVIRGLEPFRREGASRFVQDSLLIVASASKDHTVSGYILPVASIRELADQALGPIRKASPYPLALYDDGGRLVWGDQAASASKVRLKALDRWQFAMGEPAASSSSEARTLFWYGLVVLLVLVLFFGVTMTVRTAAREMELSRLQSAFAAGVTHEFKTPVTSIRLLMERISSGRALSADTLKTYSDAVMRETRRLEDLINRLLEVHRIQSGDARYHPAPHCLYEIAACAAGNLQAQASAKQIEIDVDTDDTAREIELDRTAVQDSIQNLVDNAIKYSPARTRIEIEVRHGEDYASVTVRDQGIGIEPRERAHIFDRFYRGTRGAQRLASGTGLGLWLVKAVAEAHGGNVTVTDAPGGGSEFVFRIPTQRQAVCRES